MQWFNPWKQYNSDENWHNCWYHIGLGAELGSFWYIDFQEFGDSLKTGQYFTYFLQIFEVYKKILIFDKS